MLKQAEASDDLHGYRISRGAPSISHLLCCKMHSILGEYEKISGQAVNVQKSGIFFSGNVPEALKSNISNKLGVHAPLNTRGYLGLPSLIGRNKRVIFAFLWEMMWKMIKGWQSKLLSQAGKEILIKKVA